MTTDFVDEKIHAACLENRVYPSTLNYKGFSKSVCTSINNVVCHGVPDDRPLEEGDIVNVDFTVSMYTTRTLRFQGPSYVLMLTRPQHLIRLEITLKINDNKNFWLKAGISFRYGIKQFENNFT